MSMSQKKVFKGLWFLTLIWAGNHDKTDSYFNDVKLNVKEIRVVQSAKLQLGNLKHSLYCDAIYCLTTIK